MRILNRFWSIFIIAFKRILSQPWMALATVLGMIFAISLTMSVPLYASSIYNSIFLQRVANPEEGQQSNFPPFTFLFTYDSNVLGNLNWEDLQKVNTFLRDRTASVLGLPVKMYTRYTATNPLAVFPAAVDEFPDSEKPLLWSSLAFMENIEEHVFVMEGTFPKASEGLDQPVEVMVAETLATELGLQVGEEYNLFARSQISEGSRTTVTIPVRISGVYQPNDENEDFWFIRPRMLEERMIVNEGAFARAIAPALDDEIYGVYWFLLVDGSSVRYDQAVPMINRIASLQKQAGQALPRIKLAVSPIDALISFQRASNLLTVLLYAFSVPIFGLLLAFITMTAGMTVERQRNEIAVLRSRGAMIAQMIGIATVESLLLGALAMLVALPASAGIALAISRTRSFLDFSNPTTMGVNWSANTLYFGLGAIGLTVLARLMPTFRAARDTIVLYKRERARTMRAPLWQRMWLDVLLMIPAAYGIYLLRQQGSIDAFGTATSKGDPFSNPLLIMVPALAIFAFSLFFLRLMPFIMAVITWVTSRTRSVGLMMAARHLARNPSTYTLPLVLLILTLSLSAFTATLAGTLDNHLHDQVYYRVGADMNFLDIGDSPGESGAPAGSPQSTGNSPSNIGISLEDPNPPGWFFLPVTEYMQLPEVQAVTRVGRYSASALTSRQQASGEILGVDRYSFPSIAFWRPDFASSSLGELMNRLASQPDGILVTEDFARQNALGYGDLLTVRVTSGETSREIDFYVVGWFNLFPTYYPDEGPLFVANLDTIFTAMGGEYPYDVWMRTTGQNQPSLRDYNSIATSQIGARTMGWNEPRELIISEQSRPERQGLFGVLSVGFSAAAMLTVLGFLLYALLSFQRRFVELGVLRAVGLSAGQMTIFLASELAFLILMGGLIGTGLGVWISNMFIPYLQVGGSAQAQIPPYVVYIAWPAILRVYALFGLLFFVALGTLTVLLRRMRIFQAIKMGESV